jgi:serine/threonine protein phosphatase 1
MAELQSLLSEVEATPSDDILAIGDLVRKGPESCAVLRWAMETPNVRCILGNHEVRLLTKWLEGEKPDKDSSDWHLWHELAGSYNSAMDFLRTRPLYVSGEGYLAVHAGIDPRIPSIQHQSPHDLLTIRVPCGMDVPWYEAYEGKELIVFGHWAREKPVVRANVIGLDTGCVYGGSLTALILPEKRLVSVPAKRSYVKTSR